MPPKGKYNEKGEMVDEGMLEYLGDIIGSNVFIEAIKEAEGNVEELNNYRAMKLSNVKIAEKEKDGHCFDHHCSTTTTFTTATDTTTTVTIPKDCYLSRFLGPLKDVRGPPSPDVLLSTTRRVSTFEL